MSNKRLLIPSLLMKMINNCKVFKLTLIFYDGCLGQPNLYIMRVPIRHWYALFDYVTTFIFSP